MWNIYYSLIYSVLFYCNTIWGNAGTSIVKPLFIAQKRVVRTIMSMRRRDHTNDIFKIQKVLKFEDMNKYCCALFVYKALQGSIDCSLFQIRVNDRYPTRYNNQLEIPLLNSSQTQRSIIYHGVKIWNALPALLKENISVDSFKFNLKKFLLSKY